MINVECGIVGTGGTDEMGAVRRLKSEGRGSKLRTLQPSALRPLTPRAILASLARIRLRPSAAGVRLRVVLLRHVVPRGVSWLIVAGVMVATKDVENHHPDEPHQPYKQHPYNDPLCHGCVSLYQISHRLAWTKHFCCNRRCRIKRDGRD